MGTKITQLPPVATPTGSDELPISQDDGMGGRNTYKSTLDQIKDYVKNTGGGTGTVTSVGVSSTDGSIDVFGSPIVGSGTILLTISSVGLDKLDDGGATGGHVLTYNGSTSTWVASAVPEELPTTALSGQVLSYDGSTSTWVASSIPIQDFTVSLSSNGYQKLPSGLIMQWGSGYAPQNDISVVNFPLIFPNECFNVVTVGKLSNITVGANGQTAINVISTSVNSFTAANDDALQYFFWQAIGY
jgi:hypothetical protein